MKVLKLLGCIFLSIVFSAIGPFFQGVMCIYWFINNEYCGFIGALIVWILYAVLLFIGIFLPLLNKNWTVKL